MILVMLLLAVFLVILWSKVNQNSLGLRALERRLNQLQRQLADGEHAGKDISMATPAAEPLARPPETKDGKPPVEQRVPATPVQVPPSAALKEPPAAFPPHAAPTLPPPPVVKPIAQKPAAVSVASEPALHPPVVHATARELPKFDWESLVGVKLFSWIAGVALLFAAIFFLRYSINQGWLMPKVRMAIGLLVGIGLLALCEL